MSEYVLDASAVLALLNREKGAEIVESILPRSVISTVNLAEVVTRLVAIGMPEGEIRETLSLLGLNSVSFEKEDAFEAGLLHGETKGYGLSLGDRACLALAKSRKAKAVTADQIWKNIDEDIEIELIR